MLIVGLTLYLVPCPVIAGRLCDRNLLHLFLNKMFCGEFSLLCEWMPSIFFLCNFNIGMYLCLGRPLCFWWARWCWCAGSSHIRSYLLCSKFFFLFVSSAPGILIMCVVFCWGECEIYLMKFWEEIGYGREWSIPFQIWGPWALVRLWEL